MAEPVIQRVQSEPGIKRDGTVFEGENYTDGAWVRFQRGKPRKIGGYQKTSDYLSGISRGMHAYNSAGYTYVYSGYNAGIDMLTLDRNGNASVTYDRTPVGFLVNPQDSFQFDTMYDAGNSTASVIAHVAPNLQYIDNDEAGATYIGDATGTGAMTVISGATLNGGIVVLHPYLFNFGDAGEYKYSVPNQPTDFSGTGSGNGRITGQKIVRGLPLRGSSSGPAGIFWSLDSILRASFTGSTTSPWQFDTLSSQSSILAPRSVIEYNGRYFWIGADSFLMFNGVVQELPNDMNVNFFFDNLNYAYAQKIFAFKVTRFGEIWWCFPKGNATEPNHAIILNVRESCWYDTPLPDGGRSAALYAQVFRRPLMAGVDIIQGGETYKLWQHETGVDAIDGSMIEPIPSFFETKDFTLTAPPGGEDGKMPGLSIKVIEPDFVQAGNMTVQLAMRANAKATPFLSDPQVLYQTPPEPQNQIVNFKVDAPKRQVRVRFTSNVVGGDYQMGQTLMHVVGAESKVTG